MDPRLVYCHIVLLGVMNSQPVRMTLNTQSSFFHLPRAGVTGVNRHAWFRSTHGEFWKKVPVFRPWR